MNKINRVNKIVESILYYIKALRERYGKHSISAYSAQMAFFLMLSIFPFFILLFNVLGRLSISSGVLITILEAFFPQEVHALTMDFIENQIAIEGAPLISASVIGIIWSASKGVRALMVSLNKAYEIEETRSFYIVKLLDMLYTVLIVFVIVVLLTLPSIGVDLFKYINQYFQIDWTLFNQFNMVKNILVPSSLVLFMALIYRFIPNIKIKFVEVIRGTAFSIIGWSVLSYLFKIFINEFANYRVVYGSLATVIILMFWLYFSSMILIIGGEINSIYRMKKQDTWLRQ